MSVVERVRGVCTEHQSGPFASPSERRGIIVARHCPRITDPDDTDSLQVKPPGRVAVMCSDVSNTFGSGKDGFR